MDELLAKYMLNETTPAENDTVERWMNESEENRRYFDHFKMIWDTSKELKVESSLDEDRSWAAFKQMVAESEARQSRVVPMYNKWLRIAAIWLVLIGAGVLAYQLYRPSTEILVVSTGAETKIDTLSDGSIITLNKYAQISYPEEFNGDIRNVKLIKGEAFFEVAHDKAHPFIINTNDVTVKVLGTSFNIKNTPTQTEVIVETGIVQVDRGKITVHLKRQDKVSVDKKTGKFEKGRSTDMLYNYYRTKTLVASNTPLWRVAEVLNEIYHVNIVIPNKKTARLPLTTTFRNDSLESVLGVIEDALNVDATHKGNKIIIQ
jgi:transmembrane sensor